MQRLLDHLHQLARSEGDGSDDADLLARFANHRDEAAFTALVRRHGPLVLGVCRRWLANPADADDAFQAVFLVLARRAGEITQPARLAQWLYGAAVRTAKHLSGRLARQRRFVRATEVPELSVEPAAADPDLASLLDREIQRLTVKHRLPVILCLLLGMPRREAAARLRIPEGTLSTRLAEARQRLQRRLLARGIAPAVLAGLLAGRAEAVSPMLVRLTVQAAPLFIECSEAARAPAAALAEGVLRMYSVQRLASGLCAVAAVMALGAGITLLSSRQVATVAVAADPPQRPGSSKAAAGELVLTLRPTPDRTQMGQVVITEDQDQLVAHSLRGLRKYLTRLRAAEKTPPQSLTLIVPADAKSTAVNDVMAVCREAGFSRITLQTESNKPGAETYRRLALDIVGRPPTASELAQFLNDSSPNAVDKAIEWYLTREKEHGNRALVSDWLSGVMDSRRRARTDELVAALEDTRKKLSELEKQIADSKAKLQLREAQAAFALAMQRQQLLQEELAANKAELAAKELAELALESNTLRRQGRLASSFPRTPSKLQGVWTPESIAVDGKTVQSKELVDRFRWLIVEDLLITVSEGKPMRGRIVIDQGEPGSIEVVFVAESADAPKFTGKYTLQDDKLSVQLVGSMTANSKEKAKLVVTFRRAAN